jgi:hypothetical protein
MTDWMDNLKVHALASTKDEECRLSSREADFINKRIAELWQHAVKSFDILLLQGVLVYKEATAWTMGLRWSLFLTVLSKRTLH